MMDSTDKEILNRIQREVPLEREPFEGIGRELGIAGDEVIRRIEALKRGRVIRQISAIFDTRVLLRVEPGRRQDPGTQARRRRQGYKFPPRRLPQLRA